jgi:DNA primase
MAAPEVIVVADGDDAGVKGAERLARFIIPVCGVRVIRPPDGIKDCREWIVGGACGDDLRAVAEAARIRKLNVRCHHG